jgi:hypothetical protein
MYVELKPARVRFAKGMPLPSVRLWMRMPLLFPPRATPSPPPLPGGKSAVDGTILPANHALCLGNPQNAGWHRGQGALCLPTLQSAMRRALRRPLRPGRNITPATAGHQDVEQRIQYLPKRRMGHPAAAFLRRQGQDVLEQAPFSITQSFKSSCHTALLKPCRAV